MYLCIYRQSVMCYANKNLSLFLDSLSPIQEQFFPIQQNWLIIFFIFANQNIDWSLAKQMMWLEQKYLMFSPFDISPNLLYTVLNAQPCLILNVNTETTNSILSWFYKMKKIMCLHRPGHFCKISWHIHPHRPGVNFEKVVRMAQIIEISIYHLFS